jgi:hypothetical protein
MKTNFTHYQDGGSANQDEIMQSRMEAVQGLIEQGITDPEQILNYLNYDDEGNEVGDFTLEEVNGYIDEAMNQELPQFQSPYMEEETPEENQTETSEEEPVMKMGGFFNKYSKYMYGGNAPGGSHSTAKVKFKKGGDTYGHGTDSYINTLKESFVTGMKDIVTNAQINNKLKEMGLPNNAFKMGGSKLPKYQTTGWNPPKTDEEYDTYYKWLYGDNWREKLLRQSNSQYPVRDNGYGWDANPWGTYPYNVRGGWEGLGMNRDVQGVTLGDFFSVPEIGKSFAEGKNKKITSYNGSLLGFGPKRSGTIEWDTDGYGSMGTGSYGPTESTYIDLSGKGRPNAKGMFQGIGNNFMSQLNTLGQEIGNRFKNMKSPDYSKMYQTFNQNPSNNTPGYTDDPNNTEYEMSKNYEQTDNRGPLRFEKQPFFKQYFTKEGRKERKNRKMMEDYRQYLNNPEDFDKMVDEDIESGRTQYMHGGSHKKYQYDGQYPNTSFDPIMGGAPIVQGNVPFEPNRDFATNTPSTIDWQSGDMFGESVNPVENLPQPTQYEMQIGTGPGADDPLAQNQNARYKAYWELQDPEGDVRRTLGRMSKATRLLNKADMARKNQYSVDTSTAHNAGFGSVPQGVSGQMGSHTPNVITTNFRPPEYNPVQFQGANLRTPSRLGSKYMGAPGFQTGVSFVQKGGQAFSNMDDTETEYEVGGQYYLTDDEIARIEQMGGQVQIIG